MSSFLNIILFTFLCNLHVYRTFRPDLTQFDPQIDPIMSNSEIAMFRHNDL